MEFVTASGAIEMPLGVTKNKLKFTLGRGTDKLCLVELHATVIDTTAYDVILGMEFITAVKGRTTHTPRSSPIAGVMVKAGYNLMPSQRPVIHQRHRYWPTLASRVFSAVQQICRT